jgi:D-alanyl-D-alanine carboxypeptidase
MTRPFAMNIKRLSRAALILALAFVSFGNGAVAQGDPATVRALWLKPALQRDLDDYLKKRSTAEHLSSLSLAVSLGRREPTILLTAGTTKYGGDVPVVPTDLYQIGSNTKAFTAVAILQLEAQGRLSIDAPIGEYLPQYPAFRALTLRRLLNMTSGLESYDNTAVWERQYARYPYANVSADSLVRLIYPNIRFRPGSRYYYSNTGYLLAQEIVAARSRSHSYDAELARIFASVGLRNTFYSSNVYPPRIAARVVSGIYENNDAGLSRLIGRDVTGYSLSWAQGAGAIVSSPDDLTTWARALYQGIQLLPPKQKYELKSLILLQTAKPLRVPTAADPAGFALGVAERYDPKLGTFWFYQGETLGFRAAHLYFPASDLVVSLFANSRVVESDSQLQTLFGTIYATIKAKEASPH